jgi:hypothetical protein
MNPFARYALSLLLGVGLGTLVTATVLNKRIADQNRTIENGKRCAVISGEPVTQQGWDFAQEAIRTQHASIERLNDELAKAKQSAAAWEQATKTENANFGHTAALYKECLATKL